MPGEANSMRLIGMIPRPDQEYRAALQRSMDSLKSALSDSGIDPSRIAPMPTRMVPVAEDASGTRYALVSMCNENGRPTAVPLSSIFPDDPSRPGELPGSFEPVNNWAADHPANAGLPPDVPGVTAPIETAMPKSPQETSDTASVSLDRSISAATIRKTPSDLNHPDDTAFTDRSGIRDGSSDFKNAPAMKSPPTPDEKTKQLLNGALPGMKARGSFGEMGGALLGIMAQQDPNVGRVNFQKLMAEKASALQPGSSVHTRLKDALQTFDQIKHLL